MEAKDLRIGNIIKIDGIICIVDARTLFDFDHDGRVKEGVPLTEELLTKRLGFIELPDIDSNETQEHYSHFKHKETGFEVLFYLSNFDDALVKDAGGLDFSTLHQLQNAFHVFTGEELTLKH